MYRPRLLCFDLGGVLVKLGDGGAFKRLIPPLPEAHFMLRDDFRTDREDHSLNEEYQLGLVDTDRFFRTLKERLQISESESILMQAYVDSWIVGELSETVTLLEQLSPMLPLACFSNTSPLHWSYINKEFSWMNHFTWKFASCVEGVAKPWPQAFARICSVAGVEASECVMIDDRAVNLEGARQAGMHTHHFLSTEGLRSFLAEADLDVALK